MNPSQYDNGTSDLDDQNIFVGHDVDTLRYTGKRDGNFSSALMPAQDSDSLADTLDAPRFGSAHSGTMNMAMCDGSVQSIAYDMDEAAYYRLGGRDDDTLPYPGP
jgi:prepilin-type processing-associated H-X9-DG protein